MVDLVAGADQRLRAHQLGFFAGEPLAADGQAAARKTVPFPVAAQAVLWPSTYRSDIYIALGGAVGCAGMVDVGQDVVGSFVRRSTQRPQLGHYRRHVVGEAVDNPAHQLLCLGCGGPRGRQR